MKTYNSPAQARNLREIELAASATNQSEDNGTVQSVQSVEAQEAEETRAETKTESAPKKARRKKNTEEV